MRLLLNKDIKNYVVEVDESTFNKDGGYRFKIDNPDGLNPEDVSILFNVKGKTITLKNAEFDFNGFKDSVIWNMPEVTEAYYSSADIYGLLLAPYADIKFYNGNLYGKVISRKFSTGSVSINNTSFNGCIPNVKASGFDLTCDDGYYKNEYSVCKSKKKKWKYKKKKKKKNLNFFYL